MWIFISNTHLLFQFVIKMCLVCIKFHTNSFCLHPPPFSYCCCHCLSCFSCILVLIFVMQTLHADSSHPLHKLGEVASLVGKTTALEEFVHGEKQQVNRLFMLPFWITGDLFFHLALEIKFYYISF